MKLRASRAFRHALAAAAPVIPRGPSPRTHRRTRGPNAGVAHAGLRRRVPVVGLSTPDGVGILRGAGTRTTRSRRRAVHASQLGRDDAPCQRPGPGIARRPLARAAATREAARALRNGTPRADRRAAIRRGMAGHPPTVSRRSHAGRSSPDRASNAGASHALQRPASRRPRASTSGGAPDHRAPPRTAGQRRARHRGPAPEARS